MKEPLIIIRLVGLAGGVPTSFDGKWLKSYNPKVSGVDAEGRPMIADVKVVEDPLKAKQFKSPAEAIAYWRRSDGVRGDGKPNRPLTAFHVEFKRLRDVV